MQKRKLGKGNLEVSALGLAACPKTMDRSNPGTTELHRLEENIQQQQPSN